MRSELAKYDPAILPFKYTKPTAATHYICVRMPAAARANSNRANLQHNIYVCAPTTARAQSKECIELEHELDTIHYTGVT